MMQRYYSPKTGGFYLEDINDSIPADAIAVSEEEFSALMAAQAVGKEIKPGADGKPVAEAKIFTNDELIAQVRAKRDRLLTDCDFTQLPDSPISAEQRTAWAIYRERLRNLPEACAADPASAVWPQAPDSDEAGTAAAS
jgi:hypothetical protein